MTTTEQPTNGTALATREFSDKQIRTRLNAASQPGFGMDKATPAQLNMVYLLARHYDVDPAVDITIFQGRPFFTIDGRVRLMKRHPQYRGYRCRPLPKDEKDAWGYAVDEIVVECTIRTATWGEITARGKVNPNEFGRQPVAKSHPQEMAEKRAIARASRMAFGQDVPEEDEAGVVIEERNDPERIAANVALYDRVMPTEEEMDHASDAGKPVYCAIDGCGKVVAPKLQKDSQEKFAAMYCRPHFEQALADSTLEPEPVEAA